MIEAIEPNYAIFALTAVGTKIAGLEQRKALELAQKIVDNEKPSAHDINDYIGNVYTRAEVYLLCLNYLTGCGILEESCIDTDEDAMLVDAANNLIDDYWCDIFPNPQYLRAFEQQLPELVGKPEDIRRAKPIRRNRLIELNVLSATLKKDLEPNLQELAHGVIDLLCSRNSAGFWLGLDPQSSTRKIFLGVLSGFIARSDELPDQDEQVKKLKDLAQRIASTEK